jgi:hypothetical protein
MNPRLRPLQLLALGAAAFLLGTAPSRAAETHVIKFDILDSGHMSVPVNINGKGPFKVGFDTGSPITFISTKLGKELGLMQEGGGQNPMMGAMGMNFGGQSRATLGIGAAAAKNVPMMVLDHPTVLTLNNLLGGFEGLIGFTYYSRFRMTIDYQKSEMTLKPVDFDPPDVMKTMMSLMMGGGNTPKTVPPRAVVLGIKLEDLGDDTKDARVVSVVAGSAAEAAGLRAGDRITDVNERWIFSPLDLQEATAALAPGIPAKLKVERGGKKMELTLKTPFGL